MRFSTATALGLAASTSAAVLPRSQLGSWDVSVLKISYADGWHSETVTALYTSDSYPEGINSTCSSTYDPAKWGEPDNGVQTCDNGFSYTYNGTTISLSEVVQKPSAGTQVFGSAPLVLKSNAVGRSFTGNTTVEVTQASA